MWSLVFSTILFLVTLSLFKFYKYFTPNKSKSSSSIPRPSMLDLVWTRLRRGNYFQVALHEGTKGPLVLYDFAWPLNWWRNKLLIINDAKLAKEMFQNPVFCYRLDTPFWKWYSIGNVGIVHSHGRVWREQKTFALRKLKEAGFGTKSMEHLIAHEVEEFVDKIGKKVNKRISLNKIFCLPILNSLWMLLVGQRHKEEDNELMNLLLKTYAAFMNSFRAPDVILLGMAKVEISLQTFCKFTSWCPLFLELRSRGQIFTELYSFLRTFVVARQKSLVENPREAVDFVDSYLQEIERTTDENSSFYKEQGIQSLVVVMGDFFVGGGDTTSTILKWAMLHLVRNPQVQKNIHMELDMVVGPDRGIQLSDRPRCPYLEAFLWEVLRMSPVSVSSLPHSASEDAKVGSYTVTKGTVIILNIAAIHYNPLVWDQPHEFRPQRFLSPDGKTVVKNENMVVFSVGRRMCPGYQLAMDNLFCFVGSICQKFVVKKDPNLKEGEIPPLAQEWSMFNSPIEFFVVFENREMCRPRG